MKRSESSSRERLIEACLGKWVGFGEIEMQEGPWWNGAKSRVSEKHCPVPSTGQCLVPVTGSWGRVQGKPGCGFSFLPSGTKMFQTNIFYSCSTISEKLKVTFQGLSILEKKIFFSEFSKPGRTIKVFKHLSFKK